MAESKELTLYNMDLSPFARIVRLSLAEKGILKTVTIRNVNVRGGEHLEPWFASLSPAMTVPVLSIGEKGGGKPDEVLCDSRDIIDHLENKLGSGTPLVSREEKKEVWAFVDKCYELKLSPLYLGVFRREMKPVFDMFRDMAGKTLDKLDAKAKENPNLQEAYEKKKETNKEVLANVYDRPESYDEAKQKQGELLDFAESQLGNNSSESPWLFSSYSIADVVLTCILSNLVMFGLLKVEDTSRPKLAEYYKHVKKRPSYKQANMTDALPVMMKVMLLPMMLIHKVKSLFSKQSS
jgi:glutathione S-transferase